jgi:uncharacterized protein (DUF305 family)
MALLDKKIFLTLFSISLLIITLFFSNINKKNNDDVYYAQNMLAHHSQAVKIAVELYSDDNLGEYKPFMLDTILTQQTQIGSFNLILDQNNAPKVITMKNMPGMIKEIEINKLKKLSNDNKIKYGIKLLIKHHLGGIAMSEEFKNKKISKELKSIINSIIVNQSSEVEYLYNLEKNLTLGSNEE